MATFGDMMSLLVTFFVLLLSFANMDVVKFKMAMGSMKDALGVEKEHIGEFHARSTSPIELSNRQSTPFLDLIDMPMRMTNPTQDAQMMADVQKIIAAQGLSKMVETEVGERGVIVRVKGHMLFEGGSDELHPEAFIFLDEIAKIAKSFPYKMTIEGHSDDIPPSAGGRYPTNWHLSSARAIAALRYLVDGGNVDRKRLSAAGFADTHPLVPNTSAANRAANRRVEFVYKRDGRLVGGPKKAEPWVPRALDDTP